MFTDERKSHAVRAQLQLAPASAGAGDFKTAGAPRASSSLQKASSSACCTSASCTYIQLGKTGTQVISGCTLPVGGAGQSVSWDGICSSSGNFGLSSDGTAVQLPTSGVYVASFTVTAAPADGCVISFKLVRTLAGTTITQTIPCSIAANTTPVSCSNTGSVYGQTKFAANAGDTVQLVSNLSALQTVLPASLATPTAEDAAFSGLGIASHNLTQANNVASLQSSALPITAGDSIYVAVQTGDAQTVKSVIGVVDNNGAVYTQAGTTVANGSISTSIWYTDNSAGGGAVQVTASFTGNAHAVMEVAEITGAATPSLHVVSSPLSGVGHSLVACSTVITTLDDTLGFMSVVTANNGNQSFTAVPPAVIIDAIAAPAPSGQNVAGADLAQMLFTAGAHTVCANVTGHDNSPVDYAALLVAIAPAAPSPPATTVCETPNSASLDLFLLCANSSTPVTISPCCAQFSTLSLVPGS